MKSDPARIFPLLFLSILLFFQATASRAAPAGQAATVSIPDEVLLRVIRDMLPIPLEAQSEYVQGDVTLESLEMLEVREKSIFLRGVFSGRNFRLNTIIAGREISMDLGSARLPLTCELFLRFDKNGRMLFISPRFPKPGSLYSTDPADALLLLPSAFAEKEYPVELAAIPPFLMNTGARTISVDLEPVDILTRQGELQIKMRPKVSKKP